MREHEELFALDIGTRKVMGIVAKPCEDGLEIIDVETIEHASRPMFDGQVHCIDEVAQTVKKIKERLEARLGKKLEKAGVAVAGRNLLTYTSTVAKEFAELSEVTPACIRSLELEAVDKIGTDSGKDLSEFYCVGYSPVYYELDGNRITSPVGHRAKVITAEVIVTFLPRLVLDSIFAVLRKARLEAINLTLEPISAINAIIPPEMRRLNIVLVDIGAGTSDLALSRDGVIFAYGMVPEAGDEITESISHQLLVDFSTAEKIKRCLETTEEIEYEDIWARRHRIRSKDVLVLIAKAVKKLAHEIAQAGLALNGGIPAAVVLVGGGSLTPRLIEELADGFGMPADSIGIRLPAMISGLHDKAKRLSGPEAVTPIGIALMTEKCQGLRFIEVTVNNEKQIILDFQQKKDILGVLTFAGIINAKKLYPRPGLALTVTVNGQLQIVKGTMGEPAQIWLNGSGITSLSEKIKHGDAIEFKEAQNGKDAFATVVDVVGANPMRFSYNGVNGELAHPVVMNGQRVRLAEPVPDRATIDVLQVTAREVLISQGVDMTSLTERTLGVRIDGQAKALRQRNFSLSINGTTSELDAAVMALDAVQFSLGTPAVFRIKDVVECAEGFETMHITVDDRDIQVVIDSVQVFMNGRRVSADELLSDGADIRVHRTKERTVILSEIFKYIDIDPQRAIGKRIRILVDDAPAGFTTPLAEGSRVNLLFEERN